MNPPYELGWIDKEILISKGSPITRTKKFQETYKNVSQDIRDQLNAKAEAVQIILTGIDNDIHSTVDACSNACEMWKAIERLKQGESINVQDLQTNLYWEFRKFTSQDGESLESYYSRFVTLVKENQELKTVSYHKLYDILKQHQHEVNEIRAEKIARVANPLALFAQQQPVYHPQTHPTHYSQNSSTISQQTATRNRGKAIVNSSQPIYDQEPSMVAEDDETSQDKEIDKLMALISLSFKKIYKPTNNNLQTSSNTSRANHDNSPRINRSAGYENQRIGNVAGARKTVGSTAVQKSGIQCYNSRNLGMLHGIEEAGIQLNAEQADWRDDTDDDELEDKELEAHYIEHPEQSESVYDTYPIDQDEHNVIINSLDLSYDKEVIDQNDDDNDLAKERELLASLIQKLKCEIDENKNRNKFLETSNKVLIEKLKGEIEDFKNKNKSLESSNNHFKEANNKLSETNNLLYTDYKKSEVKLARRNSRKYASQMEIECAKVRAPESDEVIRLEKESRSKLRDLIRPFDYNKLNNLYDLFIPQRKKSSEQQKRMDESIPLDKKCQSSIEIFKVKTYVNTIITGVELCKEKIANRTYSGYIDPFIQKTIEANFSPVISRINAGLEQFHSCLNEEMVADLRYFNSLKLEVDSLRSQLGT
nr:hypothetical protein [Tanacetum cinerariifolium]